MEYKALFIILIFQLFNSGCKTIVNTVENNEPIKPTMEQTKLLPPEISTIFSTSESLVLQILPESRIGKTTVNGKEAYNTSGFVFIPKPDNPGYYISCPLNYFQKNVSLPQKWILDDNGSQIDLNNTDEIAKVIITRKINGKEEVIDLSEDYLRRIANYFNLDVTHNEQDYRGFDCYAFASLIANVKYYPQSPDFEYMDKSPKIGDVVVITNENGLPESIMHWAIFLGDDQYLSKFGQSGKGAESLLGIMDLKGMKKLYDCKLSYVAVPKNQAKTWEGYKP